MFYIKHDLINFPLFLPMLLRHLFVWLVWWVLNHILAWVGSGLFLNFSGENAFILFIFIWIWVKIFRLPFSLLCWDCLSLAMHQGIWLSIRILPYLPIPHEPAVNLLLIWGLLNQSSLLMRWEHALRVAKVLA